MTLLGSTYSWDESLFNRLGLSHFKDAPHAEYLKVGRVELDDGAYVDVSVQCWPAQFWKFKIHSTDPERDITLATGSGTLTDYWNAARQIAEGMIVIKKASDLTPTLLGGFNV